MNFSKYLLVAFGILLFNCSFVSAQSFPKYNADSIRLLVNNLGGKYQYSNLLLRLKEEDTTLTMADYFLIYHGLPFQDGYDPYAKHSEIQNLFKEQSYPKVIKEADKILKKNPADIDALFLAFLSCKKIKKDESAEKYETPYRIFLESIMASGDGKSEKTALHVNSIVDEYQVLEYLELKKVGQKLIKGVNGRTFDLFEVVPSEKYEGKKIYFNISPAFATLKSGSNNNK